MALDNIPTKKIGDPFLFSEMNEMVAQIRKNSEEIAGAIGGFKGDIAPTDNFVPANMPKGFYNPTVLGASYGPTGNKYLEVPENPDGEGDSYIYQVVNNGVTISLAKTIVPTGEFITNSQKNVANGVAGLDENAELPDYAKVVDFEPVKIDVANKQNQNAEIFYNRKESELGDLYQGNTTVNQGSDDGIGFYDVAQGSGTIAKIATPFLLNFEWRGRIVIKVQDLAPTLSNPDTINPLSSYGTVLYNEQVILEANPGQYYKKEFTTENSVGIGQAVCVWFISDNGYQPSFRYWAFPVADNGKYSGVLHNYMRLADGATNWSLSVVDSTVSGSFLAVPLAVYQIGVNEQDFESVKTLAESLPQQIEDAKLSIRKTDGELVGWLPDSTLYKLPEDPNLGDLYLGNSTFQSSSNPGLGQAIHMTRSGYLKSIVTGFISDELTVGRMIVRMQDSVPAIGSNSPYDQMNPDASYGTILFDGTISYNDETVGYVLELPTPIYVEGNKWLLIWFVPSNGVLPKIKSWIFPASQNGNYDYVMRPFLRMSTGNIWSWSVVNSPQFGSYFQTPLALFSPGSEQNVELENKVNSVQQGLEATETNVETISNSVSTLQSDFLRPNQAGVKLFETFFKSIDSGMTNNGSWTTVTGGISPGATGLQQFLSIDRQYNLMFRECVIDVTMGAATRFCVFTLQMEGSNHGSLVEMDASGNMIRIYQQYTGTATFPAVQMQTAFAFTSGRKYRLVLGKENFYQRVKVIDTVTGASAELYDTSTNSGRQHDKYGFSVYSGGTPVVHSFTLFAKRVNVGCDLYVVGDSNTEANNFNPVARFGQMAINYLYGNGCLSARNGATILGVQRKVLTEIAILKPKFAFITIGTNGGNTVSNLTQLCQDIISLGTIPILNNIFVKGDGLNLTVNPMIEQVRTSLGLKGCLFDIATSINGDVSQGQDETLFNADKIHLNTLGYEKVWARMTIDLPELFY